MHKLFISIIGFYSIFLVGNLYAQNITLLPGESREIKFDQKIDTIFITDPTIANYKILNDKKLMFYGLKSGMTDVNVLSKDDKTLLSAHLIVNDLNAVSINSPTNIQFSNSNLRVKKIGEGYVVEGKAKDQNELEKVQRIVSAAINKAPKRKDDDDLGDNYGKDILTRYLFDNVVSTASVVDPKQINIRLTVASVSRSLKEQLGISWEYLGGAGGLKHVTVGTLGFDGSGGHFRLSAGALNGVINALNASLNSKILAEPNLSMLSGHKAEVLIGGEIPVETSNINGTTIDYKEYGISLKVAAKFEESGRIRVTLNQNISDIIGQTKNTQPVLSKTSAASSFEVANGESFIIGGLYKVNHSEGLNKLPIVGDIPILGAFFRDASTSNDEQELIIIATVNLVKPVNKQDVILPTFDDASALEQFFNLRPLRNVYRRTQVTNFLQHGGFIQ